MEMKVLNDGLVNPQAGSLGRLADFKMKRFLAKAASSEADKLLIPSEDGFSIPEITDRAWKNLGKRKQHDFIFPKLGPYTVDFSMSGQYMVAAGRKGHLAFVDMESMDIVKEFQVKGTVRDVVFSHREHLFATAQKNYVHLYNSEILTEVRCLKGHDSALKLQFLKKRSLLTSINKGGVLCYQDMNTDQIIAKFNTAGLGSSDILQVNRFNDVVAVGHSNGTVTMWCPTTTGDRPVSSRWCHPEPLTALAFHPNGHHMATSGMDREVKLWDMRMFNVLQTFPGHAKSLDFSQEDGMLAIAWGSSVQVFGDLSSESQYKSLYINHTLAEGYKTHKVLFRPSYDDDALAIGHSMGWSSVLIPDSGKPFETRDNRIQYEDAIMSGPIKIASVKPTRKRGKPIKQERDAEMKAPVEVARSIRGYTEMEAAAVEGVKNISLKTKAEGRRSKPRKMAKKQEAIVRAKKPLMESQIKENQNGRGDSTTKVFAAICLKANTTFLPEATN